MSFRSEYLRLYAVTDREGQSADNLLSKIEAALEGGVTMLQLREKDIGFDDFLTEAVKVKKLTDRYNIPLIINDNVEIAKISGADGVHLGQGDMSAQAARKILGPDKIIGVSARTVGQAKAAQADGADYIGSGAVFSTSTKADAKTLPHKVLKSICGSVSIPVVAIGGITEENIRRLTGTDIAGAAVVSAIFKSPDPKAAAKRLLTLSRQTVIRGAIFDLDGTLVDSMPYWDTLGSDYLISLGIVPEPDFDEKTRSMYLRESAEYIRKKYSVNKSCEEILCDINGLVEKYYSDEIKLKDGVLEMLDALDGVKKCVCTLNNENLAKAVLLHRGILDRFDFILSASDYNIGKNTPELFEIARKKLGTPKEYTYIFEDSDYAVSSAKAGGFTVVGVYDRSSPREAVRELSDFYTADYSEWK